MGLLEISTGSSTPPKLVFPSPSPSGSSTEVVPFCYRCLQLAHPYNSLNVAPKSLNLKGKNARRSPRASTSTRGPRTGAFPFLDGTAPPNRSYRVSEVQRDTAWVSLFQGTPFLWFLKSNQKENHHFGGPLKKTAAQRGP